MGMKKEKDRGTDRAIATSAVTPTCNHFPVFLSHGSSCGINIKVF